MLTSREVFGFGVFTLDPAEHRLLRGGAPLALAPKAFDLLLDLVQHAGRLRLKEDLLDAACPEQSVEEANVAYTVWEVRQALGDAAARPVYIQTVRTKGYRFIARVTRRRSDCGLSESAGRITQATTLPGTPTARDLATLRRRSRASLRRRPPLFLSALLNDQRRRCGRTGAARDISWPAELREGAGTRADRWCLHP